MDAPAASITTTIAAPARPPMSLCLGGGAIWGIGWGLGVVSALTEAGWDVGSAPMLGTSAGAWVGAAVGLEVGVDRLRSISYEAPEAEHGSLVRWAQEAFGSRTVSNLRVIASPERSEARVMLSAANVPAALVVAASSAIPGFFAPVWLPGERATAWVDGMCGGSCTNADLAAAADHLIVVAPMAHPDLPGGPRVLATLDDEIASWRLRNPGASVTTFMPDAECVGLVGDPADLFRLDLAVAAEEHARSMVTAWLADEELLLAV